MRRRDKQRSIERYETEGQTEIHAASGTEGQTEIMERVGRKDEQRDGQRHLYRVGRRERTAVGQLRQEVGREREFVTAGMREDCTLLYLRVDLGLNTRTTCLRLGPTDRRFLSSSSSSLLVLLFLSCNRTPRQPPRHGTSSKTHSRLATACAPAPLTNASFCLFSRPLLCPLLSTLNARNPYVFVFPSF